MPIFPTWSISYTGPFLPHSLPTRLLRPTFGYGYHGSLSGVHIQVLAGAGGQVVCLFPLLYSSNHNKTEQIGTLDVRYRERQSARSCIESSVTQKHGTRSKPAQMHREQAGRRLQAALCPSTAMGLEKRGTAVGRKERAGKLGKQSGYSGTTGSVVLARKLPSLQAEQSLSLPTKADIYRL